jgi:hypothetical protein
MRGLILVLMLSGCSFIEVRSTPRAEPVTAPPTCKSYGYPVADLLQAPLWFGLAAAAALQPESVSHPDAHTGSLSQVITAGVMVGLSVTTLASSIYGFTRISKCRAKLGGA